MIPNLVRDRGRGRDELTLTLTRTLTQTCNVSSRASPRISASISPLYLPYISPNLQRELARISEDLRPDLDGLPSRVEIARDVLRAADLHLGRCRGDVGEM